MLICVWLMFHYSEYIPSAEKRYDLAFYFLYLVAIDVILNVLLLIYIVVKRIYVAIKDYFVRRSRAQFLRQI